MENLYKLNFKTIWNEFKNTHISFKFICIYLFIEYVRPQSIYPVIDILPYAQISILGTLYFYITDPGKIWVKNTSNVLITLFFVIIIISSVFSYNPGIAFDGFMLFFSWYLIYFLIINTVTTEKRFFIFFLLFILVNFKMSQHGFLSWARIGFGYRDWGVGGAPGWFRNSGEFGIEMCVFTPLIIYFIISLKEYWDLKRKLILYIIPVTAIGSIIATSSRGALIGLGASILYMLACSKYKIKALVSITIISLLVMTFISPEMEGRFSSMGEDRTSNTRLEYWKAAIDLMNDHPLLGIGYNNWLSYFSLHDTTGRNFRELQHNIFLQAGSELGYTGLLLFIIMIIYCFVLNYKTRAAARKKNNQFQCNMAFGLDAALIGSLVSGFFITVLYYPYFWINLAFTVALYNITINYETSNNSQINDTNNKRNTKVKKFNAQ